MRRVLLLILLFLPVLTFAAPERAGLISAWEAAMGRDGTLDTLPDGSYHYRNESIGYDGRVKVVSAIVRTADERGPDDISANGSIDFDLIDMPSAPEGPPSFGLASWKADRQSFVYNIDKQIWQSTMEWASARYRDQGWFNRDWLLMNALPVVFVVLFGFVLWNAIRQQRRVGRHLAASEEVNRMGRESLELASGMREAAMAVVQESLAIARRNAETLDAILLELRRPRN